MNLKIQNAVNEVIKQELVAKEIEKNVEGSLYSPNAMDCESGRVCYSDVISSKGKDLADVWLSAQSAFVNAQLKFRGQNRKDFISLYCEQTSQAAK
jgi:hypothetical protein